MMAFYFVSHEIKFDNSFLKKKKNNDDIDTINITKNKPKINIKTFQKPEVVYKKGKALSLGFTNLFEYLLKKMEIKFKRLEGYCKLIPKYLKLNPLLENNVPQIQTKIIDQKYESNRNKFNSLNKKFDLVKTLSKFKTTIKSSSNILTDKNKQKESPINHCWNAVYIKGEWYFVDTLFGSGGILDENLDMFKNQNEKRICDDIDISFNPFYFMPLPKYLIMTHRPNEENWQFVDKTVSFEQFIIKNHPDISQFYRGVYQDNVELLTHD